jgi:putative endonuclease
MRTYYVYFMSNASRTLYIGVTSDLERRVWEHKTGYHQGFTTKYNIRRLVYVEEYPDAVSAIAREKQLKGWNRNRKLELAMAINPLWKDLSEGWDFLEVSTG